jgi:hypothetical protein
MGQTLVDAGDDGTFEIPGVTLTSLSTWHRHAAQGFSTSQPDILAAPSQHKYKLGRRRTGRQHVASKTNFGGLLCHQNNFETGTGASQRHPIDLINNGAGLRVLHGHGRAGTRD